MSQTPDLFGRELPLSPAVTSRVTCSVCGMGLRVPIRDGVRVCRDCGADVGAARMRVTDLLSRWRGTYAQARAEGVAVEALDAELAARWARLVAERGAAQERLDRALRGRLPAGRSLADQAVTITEARRALEAVQAKIARTRTAGGAMADLLATEERADASAAAAWAMVSRYEMALAELEELDR